MQSEPTASRSLGNGVKTCTPPSGEMIDLRCRWHSLMQTLLWLAGVSLLAQGSGCAALPRDRVSQLFGSMSVPQPWRSTKSMADPVVESTVAANTAGQVAELTDSIDGHIDGHIDDDPTSAATAKVVVPPTSIEPLEQVTAAVPLDVTPGIVTATMQRLRDALSSDVREAVAPIDPFSRQHPLRIRIESLLGRAQTALNEGDLEEARVTAERAVQLSETSALEYLPNEERPEEVLQRIVERIDSRDLAPSEVSPDALLPPLVSPARGAQPESIVLPVREHSDHRAAPDQPAVVVANRPRSVELPDAAEADSMIELTAPPEMPAEAAPVLPPHPEEAFKPGLPSRPEQPLLTVPNDPSPAPPQVDEAEPFPHVKRLSSVPTPASSLEPPIELLIWADLWPLAILGLIVLICAIGLGIRSLLERRSV